MNLQIQFEEVHQAMLCGIIDILAQKSIWWMSNVLLKTALDSENARLYTGG